MSRAIVNLYEGESCIEVEYPDDKVTTVELIGPPLPRAGELFCVEEGVFRVNEVMHDGLGRERVECSEVIMAANRLEVGKNGGV